MPVRIASLLSSSTEILYGLGLGEQVVAISHECDFPAEALRKPRVTRTRIAAEASSRQIDDQVRDMMRQGAPLYEIDERQLTALAPDLIVTQAQCDVCAVRYEDVLAAVARHPALRETQVVALNPQSLEDLFADILRVGRAAGCPTKAEDYVAALRARVEAVRAKTSSLSMIQRQRVACIEWIEPVMLGGNWMPELIEIAGGTSSTAPREHSPYVRWDDGLAYDPEVIVIMPCGFDLPRTLEETPTLFRLLGWSQVAAVKSGRVFAVDGSAYFNRSGPRLVDSLEILAYLIHPDRFSLPGADVFRRLPA